MANVVGEDDEGGPIDTGLLWASVDVRQSSANKAFIASIPGGDYEVVHPFQIRDKNERIGIDTRNYFLKAAEHYQHVTIVIRSNAVGRIKLVLERNNFIFLNRTSFRKLDSSGEHGFSQRVENCYYQGTVAGDSSSFVALSSCNGLRWDRFPHNFLFFSLKVLRTRSFYIHFFDDD
ncbi:unnamed protein product [Nippostrongylus brasiliensis]|uniref:Pep_M12B_propep domain-containing protein n=1 Tax=Nippostrongylus brasiliensis TaxID=27835 RepID=A0A0N4XJB1_NIPBR|nr:unnamed protein product [Nippostrongylus brasiliensis]